MARSLRTVLEYRVARAMVALPRPVQRLLAGPPVRVDGLELAVEVQLLLGLLERFGGPPRDTLSVEAARASLAHDAETFGGPALPVAEVCDLEADGVPVRLYVPDGASPPAPLLVYYHGGGHVEGDLDTHDRLCRWLAREARVRILSVDYRLAPEHPFPAGVEDALTAFRYARANAAALGADPARIGVGGDSAGGNLATVTAQLAVDDGGRPTPVFQLLIYPLCDYSREYPSYALFAEGFFLTVAMMRSYRRHYLPDEAAATDPRVSPLLREDLTRLPPAYVTTAGFDPLRDEGEAYARRLREAGVSVTLRRHPGVTHGFANVAELGERAAGPMLEVAAAVRWGLAGEP
jgi:acetyl esterase